MKLPIYMDSLATTPVDPRVLDKMLPYFKERFGNAASTTHPFGWDAEEAVETARDQVADLIGAGASEIIFTSGATESNNLAIVGAARMYVDKGNHIIISETEHKAVLDPTYSLKAQGFDITYLKVDKYGLIDPEDVRKSITDKTILVSIMAANNEIGTVAPIGEIGKITREKGVLFHTDAVQAVGKIPFNVNESNVDIASLTAHKMYGPKGCGALYIRKKEPRVKLIPIIEGGGHENGMRSGTLNVPGIVGFGAACELCMNEMEDESKRLSGLREKLYFLITGHLDEVYLNGHPEKRIPHNLNLAFRFVEGQSLLLGLKNVALSAGSACSSKNSNASHVLMATGIGEELASNTVRFGIHRFTTDEEIDYVADEVIKVVKQLRDLSPLYKEGFANNELKSFNFNTNEVYYCKIAIIAVKRIYK